MGCVDGMDSDPRVAEFGPAEKGTQRPDDGLVGAMVRRERLGRPCRCCCTQVGHDVAPPEGIDGLLGVADEDHGQGMAGEGPVEHLPLNRVGVLELVDEHHSPTIPHALSCRRIRRFEGSRELGEQVVVVHDLEPAFAHVDLVPHGLGEAHSAPHVARGVGA